MKSLGIEPVLVFTSEPANSTLRRLICRRLDELSVPWVDLSCNFLRVKVFNQRLKISGYRYYKVVGWPRYFDKNKRYLERLAVLSDSNYAEAIFDTFDYKAFETEETLRFTSAEEFEARSAMSTHSVKQPFVCIHSRDDRFHGTVEPQRNIPIENFSRACDYLTVAGITPIKIGVDSRPVESGFANKCGLVDYSSTFRSDMLDVWLIANAKFYLGSNSGLFYVANWFETPVGIVNYAGINESTPLREKDVYLPQKIWSRELRRLLRFSEIAQSDIALRPWSKKCYERANLEPLTSTDEEVAELAVEMNERVDGKYSPTSEDLDLQVRFRRLFKPSQAPFYAPCSVGREFLRKNLDLLE
jgi:putative glycosyltransferase (TIGR04372 family)